MLFRSADLRNRLDNSVFDSVSSQTFQAVEDYFTPLFEIVSSSVLWERIGRIDSIGNPEDYIELLESSMSGLGTVSSFSLSDSDDNELNLLLPENGEHSWKITKRETEGSLSKSRKDNGIEYLSINRLNDSPVPKKNRIIESLFRISTPYMIPSEDLPGITLRLETSGPDSPGGDEGIVLCLDLPLKQMSELIQRQGAVKDAVIFILMPSREDFIILPVDDLLRIEKDNPEEPFQEVINPLEGGIEKLAAELSSTENGDNIRFKFVNKEKTWLAEFLNISIGNEILSMGTLVPEESLWTAQVSMPLQIVLLGLLMSTGFLLFSLIRDYKRIVQSPVHAEEEIRTEINGGETFHLEFKSSLRWDYREDKLNKSLEDIIVKSVAAFSNANGGTLLIGVSDNGEILGIEQDYQTLKQSGKDYFEIHLRNLLSSKYGVGYTSKNIIVDFPWLSGHEICRIRISKGKYPLYTHVKTKSGAAVEKFYIRSGNTSQVLENPSEITAYVLSKFRSRQLRRQQLIT